MSCCSTEAGWPCLSSEAPGAGSVKISQSVSITCQNDAEEAPLKPCFPADTTMIGCKSEVAWVESVAERLDGQPMFSLE